MASGSSVRDCVGLCTGGTLCPAQRRTRVLIIGRVKCRNRAAVYEDGGRNTSNADLVSVSGSFTPIFAGDPATGLLKHRCAGCGLRL